MPDHLHVIDECMPAARRSLASLLGSFAREHGLGQLWLPVPEPTPIGSSDKLARAVRYVGLNVCRPWRHHGRQLVRLVADPLEWAWSTVRDIAGAIAEPWITAERLAGVLRWRGEDFRGSFHRYVTSDPHVDVSGTPIPRPQPPSDAPGVTLEQVVRAALSATRARASDLRVRGAPRRVFAALAWNQGFRQPSVIARLCDVHPDTVARLARACPHEWLAAAALCLGDARLLSRSVSVPQPTNELGPEDIRSALYVG